MSDYDWPYIRMRYEAGETAYAISKRMGGKPTKQAIQKRANKEAWGTDQATPDEPKRVTSLPVVAEALSIKSRKLTNDVLRVLFDRIADGAPEYIAAQAAGIHPTTLIDWKGQDEQLRDAIQRVRAGKLSDWVKRIDRASENDWKAAQALLQAAPETREHFGKGDSGGSKLEIVIHVEREAVHVNPRAVIEQAG
jgi:hypothetical protein